MRIVVLPTAADAAQFVADNFEKLLATKPNAVLGLAAGRTPELAYRLVCERHPIVDQAAAVLLDEYVGLSGTDDQSFRHQIQTTFTDPIGLDPSRLYSLDGLSHRSGRYVRWVRRLDPCTWWHRSTTVGCGPEWSYRL